MIHSAIVLLGDLQLNLLVAFVESKSKAQNFNLTTSWYLNLLIKHLILNTSKLNIKKTSYF